MVLVKICGLRHLSDMLVATQYGADLLGMVFVPNVRRTLATAYAKDLVTQFKHSRNDSGPIPPIVGLFANQVPDEVNQVAEFVGLDKVQLCGKETSRDWEQITIPVLKVFHVPDFSTNSIAEKENFVMETEQSMAELEEAGHLPILDKFSDRQPGGLGETFDWDIAKTLAANGRRFLLAGGLTECNVATAIDIVRPYGVDVSSGVETAGIKDSTKIQSFLDVAKKMDK